MLFCTFFTISHFSALTFLCFQEFKKIFELYKHVDHHCENPVLGDFFVSSPKFFSARVGGVLPLLGAEGPQKWGPRAEGARLAKNLAGAEGAGEKLALFSSGK